MGTGYRIIVNNKAFNNVKSTRFRHRVLWVGMNMGLFHTLNAWLGKRAGKMKESRFGVLAMYNALQSCVGSIAVMKVQQHNAGIFLLAVATALTMASNSVFIAQGSIKLCLLLFYLSILVNTVIIFSLGLI